MVPHTTLPLQPPTEASDSLDNFLFERQVGFCGHYAGGFTALMRAAGVPARVVSGYQGGRLIRPISGNAYLAIRQSDAHAWSEDGCKARVGSPLIQPLGRAKPIGGNDGNLQARTHIQQPCAVVAVAAMAMVGTGSGLDPVVAEL